LFIIVFDFFLLSICIHSWIGIIKASLLPASGNTPYPISKKYYMHEKDVIAGLHDDDPAAWRKIWDDYSNSLIIFGIPFLHNEEEVKDYIAGTYLKFRDVRHNFTNIQQVKAFLFITLRNALIDELRRRKTKAGSFKRYSPLSDIENQIPVEEKPDTEKLKRIVHILLNKLPTQSREVLRLHFIEELSRHEIAEKLGVSIDTVSTIKSRAIKILKKMVDDGEFPGLDPSAILTIIMLIELMTIK
jgi:RNA polymerase sigma factor (sigma-70 family)